LNKNQLAYPSEERLGAWWLDLQKAKTDRQLQWQHDGSQIRLWKGVLRVERAVEEVGEESGEWVFKTVAAKSSQPGIPKAQFLAAKAKGLINTMPRQGGEKFKVDLKRPRKSLKNLFQEARIPPWQRDIPLLYIGDEMIGKLRKAPELALSGSQRCKITLLFDYAPLWCDFYDISYTWH
jgi:tRNA(Ile)-lysidine synthase